MTVVKVLHNPVLANSMAEECRRSTVPSIRTSYVHKIYLSVIFPFISQHALAELIQNQYHMSPLMVNPNFKLLLLIIPRVVHRDKWKQASVFHRGLLELIKHKFQCDEFRNIVSPHQHEHEQDSLSQ
jgi:hypothetical protein